MKPLAILKTLTAATALVCVAATAALAGPPLLCHPFEIGPATSLPWTTDQWRGTRADYDRSRLNGDVLALLTPTTPVVVRMETLRRAALYATGDTRVAQGLLDTLRARARNGNDGGLAEFDAGYLIETYKEAVALSPAFADLVRGLDGYAMVTHSLTIRHNDPAIAFAAAIMTSSRDEGHLDHVKTARAGATADLLLAKNLEGRGLE